MLINRDVILINRPPILINRSLIRLDRTFIRIVRDSLRLNRNILRLTRVQILLIRPPVRLVRPATRLNGSGARPCTLQSSAEAPVVAPEPKFALTPLKAWRIRGFCYYHLHRLRFQCPSRTLF